MKPLTVFVSHSWEWDELYRGVMVQLHNLPIEINDNSVPKDKAFELLEGAQARAEFDTLIEERIDYFNQELTPHVERQKELAMRERDIDRSLLRLREEKSVEQVLKQAVAAIDRLNIGKDRGETDGLETVRINYTRPSAEGKAEQLERERQAIEEEQIALHEVIERTQRTVDELTQYKRDFEVGFLNSYTFPFETGKFGRGGTGSLQHQIFSSSKNLVVALSNRVLMSDLFIALPHPEHNYRDWLTFEHKQAITSESYRIGIGHPSRRGVNDSLPHHIARNYDEFFEWGDEALGASIAEYSERRHKGWGHALRDKWATLLGKRSGRHQF